MDQIISYKMCAVKVRNAKLRNYLNCSWALLRACVGRLRNKLHKVIPTYDH